MQSLKWLFLADVSISADLSAHCAEAMMALLHVLHSSGSVMVPAMRQQSHARAPLAAEDLVRSSLSLTRPSHSWLFTDLNASPNLSLWEPCSLPAGETFLHLPLLSASLSLQKGLCVSYLKISDCGATLYIFSRVKESVKIAKISFQYPMV